MRTKKKSTSQQQLTGKIPQKKTQAKTNLGIR